MFLPLYANCKYNKERKICQRTFRFSRIINTVAKSKCDTHDAVCQARMSRLIESYMDGNLYILTSQEGQGYDFLALLSVAC